MKTADLRNIFHSTADVISQKDGIVTIKKCYYWGVTKSGESYRDKVLELLPTATIVDFGNHFAPFRGGAKAGSPQSSYFWVKFRIEGE